VIVHGLPHVGSLLTDAEINRSLQRVFQLAREQQAQAPVIRLFAGLFVVFLLMLRRSGLGRQLCQSGGYGHRRSSRAWMPDAGKLSEVAECGIAVLSSSPDCIAQEGPETGKRLSQVFPA
jgi:hypothetical protein